MSAPLGLHWSEDCNSIRTLRGDISSIQCARPFLIADHCPMMDERVLVHVERGMSLEVFGRLFVAAGRGREAV